MSRRSNEAKPKDLLKIVRGNFNGVDSNDVLLSTESFVEKYGEFLEEVLAVTPRPTATLLKGAIHLAYPGVSGEEVTALANKVNEIYKTTFSRARNLKTGERLTPSVKKLCVFIRNQLGLPELLTSADHASRKSVASRGSDPVSPKPKSPAPRSRSRSKSAPSTLPVQRQLTPHISLSSEDRLTEASSCVVPTAGPTSSIKAKYQLPSASTRPQVIYHADMSKPALVKITGDSQEVGQMSMGQDGFLVAKFSDGEEKQTEIPNLVLVAKLESQAGPKKALKKPAGAKASQKKPAVAKSVTKLVGPEPAGPEPAGPEAAGPEPAAPEPEAEAAVSWPEEATLRKEYRNSNNSYCFRAIWKDGAKEQKKAILSIQGHECPKDVLSKICDEALQKLRNKESTADVRAWIYAQMP
ncbi:unnamed protein product [Symbiodinium natans]|uniref:Uncharacterized protein n=1 Tax=Symbiodinium natans TaxID=878477 RepID=A0A812TEN2_9DINO|nr:unnamed protein product [Symbiodinium natans]